MSDFSDSESDDEKSSAEAREFSFAADYVQQIHTKLGQGDLLKLYALYKQSMLGDCKTPQPSIFNMQARTKWKAWNDLQGTERNEARKLYVLQVRQIDPNWSADSEEPEAMKNVSGWVVHSIESRPVELIPDEEEKTAFDHVKESNLARLQALTPPLTTAQLKELDENGLGLIHWATDRNCVEILRHLLKAGAPVDLRDAEQQTALHYAASCGHLECAHVLLEYKADRLAKDIDGQTCIDVAESVRLRALLER